MNSVCEDLASTGQPITALVVLAIGVLVLGLLLLVAARRRTGRTAALLVAVMLLGAVLAGSAGPGRAWAGGPICDPSSGADGRTVELPEELDIQQLSTLAGLAPGVEAAPITWRIVNRGTRAALVTSIEVTITTVDKAPGAAAGHCDAGDYVIHDPVMPVGRVLQPGEAAEFNGAAIGFRDQPRNQDACQGAALRLSYRSS